MAETEIETEAVCAFCGDTETLRPSEVYFTREFIAPEFCDGIVIEKAVDAIMDGKLQVEVFEPLKVHKREGKWFTWYNQRLYLLRLLEFRGFLDFAIVRVTDEDSGKGGKKFKPLGGGETIKFRYEDILPHGPIDIESDTEEEEGLVEEQDEDLKQEEEENENEQKLVEEEQTQLESETHESSTQTSAPRSNYDESELSTTADEEPNLINQILNQIFNESNMLSLVGIAILMQVFLMWYFD